MFLSLNDHLTYFYVEDLFVENATRPAFFLKSHGFLKRREGVFGAPKTTNVFVGKRGGLLNEVLIGESTIWVFPK